MTGSRQEKTPLADVSYTTNGPIPVTAGPVLGCPVADERYQSFDEFFPFYLREHSNPANRRLHFVGTSAGVCAAVAAIVTGHGLLALGAPLLGYGAAWYGHFFIEGNKPASFKYPWWSFRGDFKMYRLMVQGEVANAVTAAHAE